MHWLWTVWFIGVSSLSVALVDTKSGNYKKTFSDFKAYSGSLTLSLDRTYNSRSLYKGLFGVGWCSNLETRLDILPDQTLKITECGGGREIIYISKGSKTDINKQVDTILKKVKQQDRTLSAKYFNTLKRKLTQGQLLRNEFLRAYSIKGTPIPKISYLAEGRLTDVVRYDNRGWFRRSLQSGIDQFYDGKTGRLIQLSDRAGNFIKITWNQDKPIKITDHKGQKVVFRYDTNNQISSIFGFGRVLAQYEIRNSNLMKAKNKDGLYVYQYDDLHNLIQITYPVDSGTAKKLSEKLTYNTRKDWVTSFTNKQKCVETYTYQVNKNNANHYWTDVKKECGRIITNESRYEFWNKRSSTGGLYLHRAKQVVNGAVSDVTYHPRFKRVSHITRNGIRVQYEYYNNGMVKKKSTKNQVTLFAKYDVKCRQPLLVNVQSAFGQAVNKQTLSAVYNSDTCLLRKVTRSDGYAVTMVHDEQGRIIEMKDQSGKEIVVRYNNRVNKPSKITHKGVGFLELRYDKNGNALDFSQKSDPLVMAQVLSVFEGLLELISPIADQVSI